MSLFFTILFFLYISLVKEEPLFLWGYHSSGKYISTLRM